MGHIPISSPMAGWRGCRGLAALRAVGATRSADWCVAAVPAGAVGDPAGEAGAFEAVRLVVLFGIGAVVMRAAGCVVNDLWDRDIDRKVARTANRPLASGVLQPRQALVFLAALLVVGLGILVQLNELSWVLGAASLVLVGLYPLAKRVTWWPQLMMGFTFGFGAPLGYAAGAGRVDAALAALYGAAILWDLGFDTIYAHQDREDDALLGSVPPRCCSVSAPRLSWPPATRALWRCWRRRDGWQGFRSGSTRRCCSRLVCCCAKCSYWISMTRPAPAIVPRQSRGRARCRRGDSARLAVSDPAGFVRANTVVSHCAARAGDRTSFGERDHADLACDRSVARRAQRRSAVSGLLPGPVDKRWRGIFWIIHRALPESACWILLPAGGSRRLRRRGRRAVG